jgi:hypothetical protein
VTTPPSGQPSLPVACTLGPFDGVQRLQQWQHLASVAGVGRTAARGAVTLRFHDLPEVGAELERLVAAEALCCDFLGWELRQVDDEWHVVITGTEADLMTLPFGA